MTSYPSQSKIIIQFKTVLLVSHQGAIGGNLEFLLLIYVFFFISRWIFFAQFAGGQDPRFIMQALKTGTKCLSDWLRLLCATVVFWEVHQIQNFSDASTCDSSCNRNLVGARFHVTLLLLKKHFF